jgi:nitrate reductase cytochrome c-type subunit
MAYIDYDTIEEKGFQGLLITTIIRVLAAVILLVSYPLAAGYDSENANTEKKNIADNDPPIIVSMKTTMYEYVTDDEDIDKMAQWIKEGSKYNMFFRNEILPMMKNDCTSCHNTSSAMTDAATEIPLSRYEDIKKIQQGGILMNIGHVRRRSNKLDCLVPWWLAERSR